MRVPRLAWNNRHNIAALTVSYSRRIWHTREAGDMILGYNATGRLARVVMLDPKRMLPVGATVRDAITRVTTALLREGEARQPDLDVLRSALERCDPEELRASG
jgi:hypothetical protein